MRLNINSNALNELSKKLKSLHKSALPVTISQTLNDAAYDVKTNTMPKTADKTFTNRQKNFFKANSTYEKAKGFNINTMQSSVGFFENKLAAKDTNYSVKDLEQQEYGGIIKKKTFIAEKGARSGKGIVKPNARISFIKKAKFVTAKRVGKINLGKNKGKQGVVSRKQGFIRAAIMAVKLYGSNAYVLGNRNAKGNRTLSKIDSLTISKGRYTFAGGGVSSLNKITIHRTALYNVKKGRVTKVKSTQFMKRASYETTLNMDKFYIKHAQERFKKYGILG